MNWTADSGETYDSVNTTEEIAFTTKRNRTFNWGLVLNKTSNISTREFVILAFYGVIVLISIFGNLLVCNILARSARMRSSTYIFIANLALSDFLMTVLNIPFNLARILLNNWPFGSFMCSFVPLVQVTSVYVSTFTMTCIAWDRFRIIKNPLKPRLKRSQAIRAMAIVWLLSTLLAVPHAVFNRIETIFTFRRLIRCRTTYPVNMRSWITLTTAITQYFLPLTVTGGLYWLIMVRIWSRGVLGVVTEGQLIVQARAKRKTIKMLVLVVILFAICWLPLNVYNLLREFNPSVFMFKSSKPSTIFFICHWLAMSSVCYNPFIYCWLNDNFRSGAVQCLLCVKNIGQRLNSSLRSTKNSRLSSATADSPPQVELDRSSDSAIEFTACGDSVRNSIRTGSKAQKKGLNRSVSSTKSTRQSSAMSNSPPQAIFKKSFDSAIELRADGDTDENVGEHIIKVRKNGLNSILRSTEGSRKSSSRAESHSEPQFILETSFDSAIEFRADEDSSGNASGEGYKVRKKGRTPSCRLIQQKSFSLCTYNSAEDKNVEKEWTITDRSLQCDPLTKELYTSET